ncbi:MAG: Mrp/NBP35 family ATP-binding protein [Bacteroidetes bacterium]|nr:Mrp/NBP35 family ATP-binding protein [Bacteroidota bacterium]
MSITKEQVIDALRYVDDPDLKKDLITLNMVKDIEVNGKHVAFTVVLTTPACPMKDMIQKACVNAILHFVDKEAVVNVTMTANVTTARNSDNTTLSKIKNIIAVASGKGGVGKSTVASNLAVALTRQGARVGLVDADIYGPSQTIMFDVANEMPGKSEFDGKPKMKPVESYGVKLNSVGFLAGPDQVVALRGPMASKALTQLFLDTNWGELDYLIVDLPPGTGDIQITLCSQVPLTGAVIVCTPQPVAIADARKGIALFNLPAINVPVLGVVENMAWFTPEELPDNKYYIFGKDGARNLAEEMNLPLLGQIPIVQSIREAGDAGRPAVLQETTPQALAFMEMAQNIAQQVAIQNASKQGKAEMV